ncbi:MAG: 50S ribosomal protein L22 [Candidatus Dormibacteraeota bacterium]|jgi:large subunit ribosomal protein L22|nr:50S ribosomal protein L22 [Candidatus Dormibacteraeota bacterium]
MQVQATAKWVRVPPRKARLVADLVQGMPVSEALTTLAFLPQAAAEDVSKVVRSAAANAENNFSLDRDRLQLVRLEVAGGPIIKRYRPRARGSSFSIFKRTCHLVAVVEDNLDRPTRVRRRAPQTVTPSETANSGDEEE